jgi:DNA-binding transcriptional regulator YdaS (Cro superfamily)
MAKERVFKDKGLAKAIKATGGVRALARALGMDHATILRWTRVPYERVLDVEQVTGVPREELRPELHRRSRSARARDQGARRAAGGRAHD